MNNESSCEAPNSSRYSAMASRASATRFSGSCPESFLCEAEAKCVRFLRFLRREIERKEKEMDMEVLLGFKGGFGEMKRFGFRTGELHGEGRQRGEDKWRWCSGGAAIRAGGAAVLEFMIPYHAAVCGDGSTTPFRLG